jgi:hypothetical protein
VGALLDILGEHGITSKQPGGFENDNHKANDAAIVTLIVLKELYPRVMASEIKSRRFRCIGHVSNLAAISLLGASDAEKAKVVMEMDGDPKSSQMLSFVTFKEGPLAS